MTWQAQERSHSLAHSHSSVEDYRPGYPRYSALLAAHKSFHLYRQFTHLRVRLLLFKQDRLSLLEKQLETIDAEETSVLFLASHRRNGNPKRESLLRDIDVALADYGKCHSGLLKDFKTNLRL